MPPVPLAPCFAGVEGRLSSGPWRRQLTRERPGAGTGAPRTACAFGGLPWYFPTALSPWPFLFTSQGPPRGSVSTTSLSRSQGPPNPKPRGLPRCPSAPSWLPRPPATVASPPSSSLTRRAWRWTQPSPRYTRTTATPRSVCSRRVSPHCAGRWFLPSLPVMCEKLTVRTADNKVRTEGLLARSVLQAFGAGRAARGPADHGGACVWQGWDGNPTSLARPSVEVGSPLERLNLLPPV